MLGYSDRFNTVTEWKRIVSKFHCRSKWTKKKLERNASIRHEYHYDRNDSLGCVSDFFKPSQVFIKNGERVWKISCEKWFIAFNSAVDWFFGRWNYIFLMETMKAGRQHKLRKSIDELHFQLFPWIIYVFTFLISQNVQTTYSLS